MPVLEGAAPRGGWSPYYPYGGTRRILPFGGNPERGLEPLLPLRGGRAELCLLGGIPSQVWTPYYPYG